MKRRILLQDFTGTRFRLCALCARLCGLCENPVLRTACTGLRRLHGPFL